MYGIILHLPRTQPREAENFLSGSKFDGCTSTKELVACLSEGPVPALFVQFKQTDHVLRSPRRAGLSQAALNQLRHSFSSIPQRQANFSIQIANLRRKLGKRKHMAVIFNFRFFIQQNFFIRAAHGQRIAERPTACVRVAAQHGNAGPECSRKRLQHCMV